MLAGSWRVQHQRASSEDPGLDAVEALAVVGEQVVELLAPVRPSRTSIEARCTSVASRISTALATPRRAAWSDPVERVGVEPDGGGDHPRGSFSRRSS